MMGRLCLQGPGTGATVMTRARSPHADGSGHCQSECLRPVSRCVQARAAGYKTCVLIQQLVASTDMYRVAGSSSGRGAPPHSTHTTPTPG